MSLSKNLFISFLFLSPIIALTNAHGQTESEVNATTPNQAQQKPSGDELEKEINQNKKKDPKTQNEDVQKAEGDAKFGFQFSAGFPTGYGVGVNYLTSDAVWGFGADYSTYSLKSGTAPEISATMSQMKVVARYHPWASAFFTGLYLGSQTTNFEGTDTYLGQRITAKLEIKNTLVTPHIGWQWMWDSGIVLGMELGAQINTGATTKFTDPTSNALILNDDTYLNDKKKIEDEGKKFGSATIPHIMLLRLGYMF